MTGLFVAVPLGDHQPCAGQAFQNRAELCILFTTMTKSLTKASKETGLVPGPSLRTGSPSCPGKRGGRSWSTLHPLSSGSRDELTVVLSLILPLTLSGALPAHGCCCPHSRWVSSLQLKAFFRFQGKRPQRNI